MVEILFKLFCFVTNANANQAHSARKQLPFNYKLKSKYLLSNVLRRASFVHLYIFVFNMPNSSIPIPFYPNKSY